MLLKCYKANAVLAIVLDLWTGDDEPVIEPYVNGREIGFAVKRYPSPRVRPSAADRIDPRQCVFSEYRNSDNIVVYSSTIGNFSMQGNTPTDNVYNQKRMFDPHDYVGAAKYICEQLDQVKQ